MSRPLVTFLMGVHNEEDTLPRALREIQTQTYQPWELVVVDDASTDGTAELLRRAAELDGRIRWIRNDANLGLTRSLNRGLALARGDYIARRDPDDSHDSDSLEVQIAELEGHPRVQAVSSDYFHVSAEGEVLRVIRVHSAPLVTAWHLIFYNRLGIHSGVVFRTGTARDLGGYDERHRYAQDFDFWQRMGLRGEIRILPRFLTRRTFGQAGSISKDKAEEQEACALAMAARRMEELCGAPAEPSEVAALRAMWMGRPFPTARIPALNRRMSLLYQGLKKEQASLGRSEDEWGELRRLVEKRWKTAQVPLLRRFQARRAASAWSSA
jgi:hypothetical protein